MTSLLYRWAPPFAVMLSVPFFLAAAAHYPGGHDADPSAQGFSFLDNYVSALFQPLAINGEANAARIYAIPAMLLLCTAMAVMFHGLSRPVARKALRKAIEIGGIGAAVYAFLGVVTPMHDLLVVISAVFFAVAAAALAVSLHGARRWAAVGAGVGCLGLLAALVAMRHGGLPVAYAPATEWALFIAASLWLCGLHIATSAPRRTS